MSTGNSPRSNLSTLASAAHAAALDVLGVVHHLRGVGREAEPLPENSRAMRPLALRLFGDVGSSGLRAELERTLSCYREAITPLLPRLAMSRHGQLFRYEDIPSASASLFLLERATHALLLLNNIPTPGVTPDTNGAPKQVWSGKAVSILCEQLYGRPRPQALGEQGWTPGILPADPVTLRAELDVEFAPLLAAGANTDGQSSNGRQPEVPNLEHADVPHLHRESAQPVADTNRALAPNNSTPAGTSVEVGPTDPQPGFPVTRIAVPRGNEWVTVPAPRDLTASSPRWSLLTPDEQEIAIRTAGERVLTPLVSARQVMRECLKGLRLARTVAEWRERSARLERVKAVMFKEADDDSIRRRFLNAARIRLILLGADRGEAEQIAPELVESVVAFRTAGNWQPLQVRRPWIDDPTADIRDPSYDEKDQAEAERLWDADTLLLVNRSTHWKDRYEDHELRAFPDDPVCPFSTARGPVIDYESRLYLSPEEREVPAGFTRPGVELATRHVKDLLAFARMLIHRATDAERMTPSEAAGTAKDLDELSVQLRSKWASEELREHLHRHRSGNYSVAGVIRPSVHETVEQLARNVWSAFRNALNSASLSGTLEFGRMMAGPWQWHEVLRAFLVLKRDQPELLSALDGQGFQQLNADLERESAQLLAAASASSLSVNGHTQFELPAARAFVMSTVPPPSSPPNVSHRHLHEGNTMSREAPSPFTIPEPSVRFAEGPPSEEPPLRSTSVAGLIHNLTVFADFYLRATTAIENAAPVMKPWHVGNRDANAEVMQRQIRRTVAIDRVRAYVFSHFGEELTIGTARRFLGDLIRVRGLQIETAENMLLEEAIELLAPSSTNTGGAEAATPPSDEAASIPAQPKETKRKKSSVSGDARAKLIAALTTHHQYSNGGCGELAPVGNNDLARLAGVDAGSASRFFKKQFGGHTEYLAVCRDPGRLVASLKLLNNEFTPQILNGGTTIDEVGDRG
jgi:hypothetical protein